MVLIVFERTEILLDFVMSRKDVKNNRTIAKNNETKVVEE